MLHSIPRALAAAALGALAGAACLVGASAWSPGLTFDMDRALPAYASGFHPPERDGQDTFAWTSARAAITLAGLDRRVPWTCAVRFRGARAADARQPDVVLAVDGAVVGTWRAANAFRVAEVAVPTSPATPGLTLTLTSTETFVPGAADTRTLGVQIDRLSCTPASGVAVPPRAALGAAAASAALLGAGFALAGITAASAIGAAVLMAAGQAYIVTRWGAQFGPFLTTMIGLAFWMAAAMAGLSALLGLLRREPLRNTAKFVVTCSAGTLYLQLLALLHPSKAVIDALFHAHRFDQVLAGNFYFTQLSTSATPFPYAIGLYLFAAPWALLTDNHLALLRVVVSAAEIVAGALLYLMVVRGWGNRLVGAVAVALFSLAPLTYGLVGSANLTNVFGQAVSIAAVAVVVLSAERLRATAPLAGVVLLVAFGLICHVSTLVLLPATLVAIAALYSRFGTEPLRSASKRILLATIAAAVVATVVYWGHFGDVYMRQIRAPPRSRDRRRARRSAGRAGRSLCRRRATRGARSWADRAVAADARHPGAGPDGGQPRLADRPARAGGVVEADRRWRPRSARAGHRRLGTRVRGLRRVQRGLARQRHLPAGRVRVHRPRGTCGAAGRGAAGRARRRLGVARGNGAARGVGRAAARSRRDGHPRLGRLARVGVRLWRYLAA